MSGKKLLTYHVSFYVLQFVVVLIYCVTSEDLTSLRSFVGAGMYVVHTVVFSFENNAPFLRIGSPCRLMVSVMCTATEQ